MKQMVGYQQVRNSSSTRNQYRTSTAAGFVVEVDLPITELDFQSSEAPLALLRWCVVIRTGGDAPK